MAGNLRRELDALMKAKMEQTHVFHDVLEDRSEEMMSARDTLRLLIEWNSILRQAILRLADEIDALRDTET